MGASDKFGHFPDIDSSVAPSDLKTWSIAPDDAAALTDSDLATQTNLRKIAEQRAHEIQARCNALQAKLAAQEKRAKRKAPEDSATASRDAYVQPKKRSTPPAQPITDILASQNPPSSDDDSRSDDEVSKPDEKPYAKQPTFDELNSVVCEYKSGRLRPSFDGNVTYKICAEMCEEEADEID